MWFFILLIISSLSKNVNVKQEAILTIRDLQSKLFSLQTLI